ncbi:MULTISPECIES: GntR family transcriptional regulator [Streptomyces]|uniref:GntR family transcriptional regulator n=2 Tax=Streptomyces TaxID=1883 RepID=A0A2U9P0K6_STRAS|nr:GntR family transcriptional regulator [Streptomyces actuosus]AWT43189.1 GntR family transcriptional regulator [Streptomyces actuosus]MBM4824659.1 GntR family transcriptional regulator [Streptomyces actuosus]
MSTEPPLYLRVAEELRGRIESGELGPGTRLPSVAEISAQYGCSNSVASGAYKVLVDDGLVVSRHGAGHYVRSPETPELLVRQHRRRSEDSPFAQGAAEQGAVGTWRHESTTEQASEAVAVRLGIAPGDPVMHTSYVYLADDKPVQLAESWEPLALTGQSLIALPEVGPYAGVGVAARMRVISIEVGDPVERVRARMATRTEAQALGMTPPGPVLAIERTYYDQATGRAVETADVIMRGDRWVAVYGQQPEA